MRPLLIKEVNAFLSSLIGYVVMVVFLLLSGLFLWVFEGDTNILNSNYADLSPFFYIAPWVFLFLIPAISMRSFAEEKKSNTLELLLTKPLSLNQLIMGKFFAGFILVLITLIPTLIYVITIYNLGNPIGNIDMGGTWGSYIGLLFLSASFLAIGIFSSSITSNQIIAFILATFLSFFFFIGFESIASFKLFGSLDSYFIDIGINAHYQSLSRGVIDTRDVIYFLTLISLFILSTKLVIKSRMW
jgi:ABC-2 type transport system permease protein